MPWWAGWNGGKMHQMGLWFHNTISTPCQLYLRLNMRTFDDPTSFLKLCLFHPNLICRLVSHKNKVPILNDGRLARPSFIFSPYPVPSLQFIFSLGDCADASLNGDYHFLLAFATLDGHIANGFDTDGAASVEKWSVRWEPEVTSRPKSTIERCAWSVEIIGAVWQQLRQGHLGREVDQMVSNRQR